MSVPPGGEKIRSSNLHLQRDGSMDRIKEMLNV